MIVHGDSSFPFGVFLQLKMIGNFGLGRKFACSFVSRGFIQTDRVSDIALISYAGLLEYLERSTSPTIKIASVAAANVRITFKLRRFDYRPLVAFCLYRTRRRSFEFNGFDGTDLGSARVFRKRLIDVPSKANWKSVSRGDENMAGGKLVSRSRAPATGLNL